MKRILLIVSITLLGASALAAPARKPLQHAPTSSAPAPEPVAALLLATGVGAFALRWRRGR